MLTNKKNPLNLYQQLKNCFNNSIKKYMKTELKTELKFYKQVKFYKQIDGQERAELLANSENLATSNDVAHTYGRAILKEWAVNDLEQINDKGSSEYKDLQETIEHIKEIGVTSYHHDNCTYYFKVLSKKFKVISQ